jgi:hypothetical protein
VADNTTINLGSGGDTIATDDLTTLNGGASSGVKVQRVKVGFGSDAALRDVDSSNPLPVTQSTAPLPTGAATEATLSALNTKVPASPATDRATAASPGSVRLSDGSSFYNATTPADTQPVSAASLPLPSGASTAAKQPALGTAGTASADVLTVQGIASMTALKTDGSATTQPVSGTVTANIGTSGSLALDATLTGGNQQVQGNVAGAATDSGNPVKVGAKYNATPPTYTDGQRTDLQSDTRGSMKVTLMGNNATTSVNIAADNADAVATSGTSRNLHVLGRNTVYNGTTWDRQYGDATNGTWANIKASVGIGSTGAAVPATANYNATLAQTALPTAATAGNLTGTLADKFGRQVVINGAFRDLVGTQTTTISASTSETTIVTAAASIFKDITALTVANTSATATRVDFRDTTAGSVLFSLYIPAGDVRGISFTVPEAQTSVNTNWTAQSSASVTDLRIFAQFINNR